MDKCKSDTKDCVTSALDGKSAAEIEKGDEEFWRNIRVCTVFRNINGDGDGNKMDCVFIFRNRVEKDCANQDCRFPRELPDFCAKLGGCEECEPGASDKYNGGLEDKFPEAVSD
ncbi:hypothetical protein E5D57_002725 [Metarhizium anisopliae]|nr:hypothetical protein E5D57_002725 [Metarhizium anisopliae]